MSTVPRTVPATGARPAILGAPAGIVSRAIASTIDAILVFVAILTGYLCVAGLLFLVHPKSFSFPAPHIDVLVPVALAVAWAYLATCWTLTGRTHGDRLLGLRVVGRRGGRLRARSAIARAAAYVVMPVGLAWVVVSRDNRSVQDILFRTRVIYDWD